MALKSMENNDKKNKTDNSKKCKKCCQSGLHLTKNGICLQTLKPFQSTVNSHQFIFNESEFTKEIISNNIEKKSDLEVLEEEEIDLLDVETILNQLETCFE